MLGVKRNKVILVPHDSDWEEQYKITKIELENILGDNLIQIKHVGSTVIKGIVAKPILDIAVKIKSVKSINISKMKFIGYDYCADKDVKGRYLFVKRVNGEISTHHIHCYLEKNDDFQSIVLFCDYLNGHPKLAKEYNDLKLQLASKYPDDRISYTDAKSDFINKILLLAKDSFLHP